MCADPCTGEEAGVRAGEDEELKEREKKLAAANDSGDDGGDWARA